MFSDPSKKLATSSNTVGPALQRRCDFHSEDEGRTLRENLGLTGNCSLLQTGITDVFTLELKIALYLGLIFAGPVWLYQLWAFIAPGLHKHERKWAYWFTGVAAPLFAAGAALAYFIIARGLEFLIQFTPPNVTTAVSVLVLGRSTPRHCKTVVQ